jgi:hypothetical protein
MNARLSRPRVWLDRLTATYRRQYGFIVLALLFIGFRLLALLLFRPGGFIADHSDYDFYLAMGQLAPKGYQAYVNLWSAYPPLFPALVAWVFELSSRIPPWVDGRLFFHTFLGVVLLVFEAGNLVLVYRLAHRLAVSEGKAGYPLRAPAFYALLFAPAYTLLGWFEALPLFFMLLGLELLLAGRRRAAGWVASALAAGLGFLTKLTPILLVPLAARWLGARLSLDAARREWFRRRAEGSLLRPALYAVVFAATVAGLGLPLARFNLSLIFSSLRAMSIRPPWQSVWALLDGFYGYGLIPLDMRNLAGLGRALWQSRLPWGLIAALFLALLLWLYTRRYDWSRPRTLVALAGVMVLWLFVYSKGWSPQYAVWIAAFVAILQPTLRGAAIVTALAALNVLESQVFIIMLPQERWLLWLTVLARTALILALAADWLGSIWPRPAAGRWARRAGRALTWATLLAAVVTLGIGAPALARAYDARRLAEHPCAGLVQYLQEQAEWPARHIATEQIEVWQWLYPWLRSAYAFTVLDDYSPDRNPAGVAARRLNELAASTNGEFWWVQMETAETRPKDVAGAYFAQPNVQQIEAQTFGACRVSRVVSLPAAPLSSFEVAGGPIRLLGMATEQPRAGAALHVVLYWQARAPVQAGYTVFVQVLDAGNRIVAQRDSLPAGGAAPTDTWTAGAVVRDAYRLELPASLPAGVYRLWVGLYDTAGRRPATLADGTQADHVEWTLEVKTR